MTQIPGVSCTSEAQRPTCQHHPVSAPLIQGHSCQCRSLTLQQHRRPLTALPTPPHPRYRRSQHRPITPFPTPCRYSSAIACVTPSVYAYAAYNYVVFADPSTKTTTAVLLGHGNKVTSLAASQPGDGPEVLLSGSRDKSVVAWTVNTRTSLRKRQKLDDEVTALATVPNAPGLVVIACKNGALRSWLWHIGA